MLKRIVSSIPLNWPHAGFPVRFKRWVYTQCHFFGGNSIVNFVPQNACDLQQWMKERREAGILLAQNSPVFITSENVANVFFPGHLKD